jgi:hypothetical protein
VLNLKIIVLLLLKFIEILEKFNKSPIAKNMTSDGNTIELKVSYPYVKKLKTFKCKASSQNNETVQGIYKVNVRQLPSNPKILSHSLSFGEILKT